VVSPAAGFTPIGSVWMVGNVEARYRNQTEVQNRFSAFEDKSEDAKEVEEKTSEPYISPKAKKEAFWIRSQAKEKEAKKKAKEENELMESLIGIPEAVIDQRCHPRKKRVRLCEEFTSFVVKNLSRRRPRCEPWSGEQMVIPVPRRKRRC